MVRTPRRRSSGSLASWSSSSPTLTHNRHPPPLPLRARRRRPQAHQVGGPPIPSPRRRGSRRWARRRHGHENGGRPVRELHRGALPANRRCQPADPANPGGGSGDGRRRGGGGRSDDGCRGGGGDRSGDRRRGGGGRGAVVGTATRQTREEADERGNRELRGRAWCSRG